MEFYKKLDLLMRLTNTSNSALALAVSLDPSHISRLRSGGRKLPENADFISPMAAYFSRKIQNEYQKRAMQEALRLTGGFPEEEANRTHILSRFLSGPESPDGPVEAFLDYFSRYSAGKSPTLEYTVDSPVRKGTKYYYGPEGKRDAVVAFLTAVLARDRTQTLMLFSDEEMSWLFDDPVFEKKWAMLLSQVLSRGNRIRIIHTVSRNMDEMLTGIANWLPIYMTGSIEPYFYPRIRDGIYRRTLFLSPGTAALTSNSIQGHTDGMLNHYLTDEQAIHALTGEFEAYWTLCRPLMRIFTGKDNENLLNLLREFENESAPAVVHPRYLSLLTLPREALERMMRRSRDGALFSIYQERTEKLEQFLQTHTLREILGIPELAQILEGKVPIPFSDFMQEGGMYYTPEEFQLHLEHIIQLLQTQENYQAMLREYSGEEYLLYAKEEVGFLVARTAFPTVVFAINDSGMTASFWDYLSGRMDRQQSQTRETVIRRLTETLDSLKRALHSENT